MDTPLNQAVTGPKDPNDNSSSAWFYYFKVLGSGLTGTYLKIEKVASMSFWRLSRFRPGSVQNLSLFSEGFPTYRCFTAPDRQPMKSSMSRLSRMGRDVGCTDNISSFLLFMY
jgi:hypothetical protein